MLHCSCTSSFVVFTACLSLQILMNARAPKQTSATPMRYVTTLMGLLCVVVSMDIKATVEVAQVNVSLSRMFVGCLVAL